jgi:carbonic anhydrase
VVATPAVAPAAVATVDSAPAPAHAAVTPAVAPTPAPAPIPVVRAAGGAARSSAVLSLASLIAGNERYAAGRAQHPRAAREDRQQLLAGQHPRAIVLACADSRVPPELVFDQGLGDLFVVRVAGEAVDAASVASIEYAIEHLGASLIVVLGHQSCGAVMAALTTPHGKAGSPDLDALLDEIRPGVAHFMRRAATTST